jgi:SpoVK/Ycf46/Vps4 family AAA+-type ATPase
MKVNGHTLTSQEQLAVLIAADYPIIYVVSHEEERVVAAIEADAYKSRPVFDWSCSRSLRKVPAEGTGRLDNLIRGHSTTHKYIGPGKRRRFLEHHGDGPEGVLNFIEAHSSPALFILRGLGHFLTPDRVELQRRLREAADSYNEGICIIIIDSVLVLPPRLERHIAVLDYDTPTKAEIADDVRLYLMGHPSVRSLPKEAMRELALSVAEAGAGLTQSEIVQAVEKSLVLTIGRVDPQIILDEKRKSLRNSSALEYVAAGDGMDSVGGLATLKSWVRARASAFGPQGEAARKFGIPAPKGLLLFGVSGTGKSLVAKCIGSEWNVATIRLDYSALFDQYMGQSETNLRKALKAAEAFSPCVLWIDELDKAVPGTSASGDAGTSARVLAHLLTWMQERTAPVFVVATANSVHRLPPEIIRRGRVDELFFVDLPGPDAREEILSIHIAKSGRDGADFDLQKVRGLCESFSGDEIRRVVINALIRAFGESREMSTEDLAAAASELIPVATTMAESVTGLRKWAKGRAISAE